MEVCRGAHLRLVIILYIAEDASRSPCPDMFYVSVSCLAQVFLSAQAEESRSMSSVQELLRDAWLGARKGNLCALSECKAWALREVWREQKDSDHGLNVFVSQRLKKNGGGHPGSDAIAKLFNKIDADPAWFPGKKAQAKCGPKPALSATAKQAIAKSAMSMKERGEEPTYAKVVGTCKQAILNPATTKPVDKKRVYDVFRAHCHDKDSDEPWCHQARMSKVALGPEQMAKRYKFSVAVLDKGHTEQFYFDRLVWTDLCNSILPRSEKKASEQALARKGKKGWISGDCKMFSQNLRGKQEALKQKSWDTIRVWWAPVLARGKLHIEMLGQDFPGEVPAGGAILVEKVRAALNVRFRADAPSVLYVDRGKGFYDPGTGNIVPAFKAALRESNLRAFWGDDASAQPGNVQEMMLHETAVSWMRHRLRLSTPKSAAEETRCEYESRLRDACRDINEHCDVEGLCRGFLKRMHALKDAQGGGLPK